MLSAFAAIVLVLVTSALSAHADTYTYAYRGASFTSASGSFTTNDCITGYFALPYAPAQNLHDANIVVAPDAFSFTDGVDTFDGSQAGLFFNLNISTDSLGHIDTWYMSMHFDGEDPPFKASSIFTASGEGPTTDTVQSFLNTNVHSPTDGSASNRDQPGTWTESINGVPVSNSPVPEPSTLVLLATGTLGLLAVARYRGRVS